MNDIVDKDVLKRVEKLACIKIAAENIKKMQSDLANILNFVKQVENAKLPEERTDDGFWTRLNLKCTPMREDVGAKNAEVDDILGNASVKKNNMFVVPKIL